MGLEEQDGGGYSADGTVVNERELQTDLDLKYEDQTLAVYPAPTPPPYPVPFPMDREAATEAYQAMVTAEAYKLKPADGSIEDIAHRYQVDPDSPVLQVSSAK